MSRPPQIASVVNWLGHDFLKVGGVTMARAGDVCRDAKIFGSYWTSEMLHEAARRINRAVDRRVKAKIL
jgi:hypothetical protein